MYMYVFGLSRRKSSPALPALTLSIGTIPKHPPWRDRLPDQIKSYIPYEHGLRKELEILAWSLMNAFKIRGSAQ